MKTLHKHNFTPQGIRKRKTKKLAEEGLQDQRSNREQKNRKDE